MLLLALNSLVSYCTKITGFVTLVKLGKLHNVVINLETPAFQRLLAIFYYLLRVNSTTMRGEN